MPTSCRHSASHLLPRRRAPTSGRSQTFDTRPHRVCGWPKPMGNRSWWRRFGPDKMRQDPGCNYRKPTYWSHAMALVAPRRPFQPEDRPTVIPRIITDDVGGMVEFLRSVFGALGQVRSGAPAEMKIGDSIVMASDGGGVRQVFS